MEEKDEGDTSDVHKDKTASRKAMRSSANLNAKVGAYNYDFDDER